MDGGVCIHITLCVSLYISFHFSTGRELKRWWTCQPAELSRSAERGAEHYVSWSFHLIHHKAWSARGSFWTRISVHSTSVAFSADIDVIVMRPHDLRVGQDKGGGGGGDSSLISWEPRQPHVCEGHTPNECANPGVRTSVGTRAPAHVADSLKGRNMRLSQRGICMV